MDRARVLFFALIALLVVVGLVAWIHTLNRRIDDLTAQVGELSGRVENVERGTSSRRPGEGESAERPGRMGGDPGIGRRPGEGGSPRFMPPPSRSEKPNEPAPPAKEK